MEMNDRINTYYPSMTKSEQKVARCVRDNPDNIIYLSVTELADFAGTGETTVMRFCRKIGFKGYQDFKLMLAQGLPKRQNQPDGEQGEDDYADHLYTAMVGVLQSSLGMLDRSQLEQAVKCLDSARHVQFFGVGSSGITAMDAKNRFLRIGRRTEANSDSHIQSMMAVTMGEGDVAFGISVSGSTLDTNDMLMKAKQNGAKVIAMTNYAKSPIASIADILLLTAGKESPLEGGSVGAKISQLFIIDLLCQGLEREHGEETKKMKELTARAVIDRIY
ncbi:MULTISPECIES: MurR/RpiR family transcriptional regulator [unclassified Paenibacillus]|uniref:MurR/RpiR family transcriptional regulator n=1 Tax=unclassified Paenibacillus TaxID=185978 RepID=UPI0009A87207|nr:MULTISPECIES: MurR/RpiR family transcriptional regulator [unclassified Paenibacillus]SLK11703.1 transcriptional regulator, RpiR family [Paenibacillus sp. RU5A]SOC72338.1 transcriptional regulator, RpiR family [Paenibacillus sp. RU26A]SOC74751.1 transcriptional regulator, RpiR family [Paenibacillus sp. RU5M]